MKIKGTDELAGGYNPVFLNIKRISPNENYFIYTDESFIFKIDQNQIGNSVLSRVKKAGFAMYHNGQTVDHIVDGIKFHEAIIDFYDLRVYNDSVDNNPYCYYSFYNVPYERHLNFRNHYNKVHLLEEFEVYKIVKKINDS